MAHSGRNGKLQINLTIISAIGAVAAALLSAFISIHTADLEGNVTAAIAKQQSATQKAIAKLEDATKRQIAESEGSVERARLFTEMIEKLGIPDSSGLVLLALWQLYSKPEERRIICGAALEVRNPKFFETLKIVGEETGPCQSVIKTLQNSETPEIASAANALSNILTNSLVRRLKDRAELIRVKTSLYPPPCRPDIPLPEKLATPSDTPALQRDLAAIDYGVYKKVCAGLYPAVFDRMYRILADFLNLFDGIRELLEDTLVDINKSLRDLPNKEERRKLDAAQIKLLETRVNVSAKSAQISFLMINLGRGTLGDKIEVTESTMAQLKKLSSKLEARAGKPSDTTETVALANETLALFAKIQRGS